MCSPSPQTHLKSLFDSNDYDRDGRLEFSELDSFLAAALSAEVSEAELRYFQVMMDTDGDGAVTFKEMVAALRECWATSQAVLAKDRAEGVEVLARAALYLKREKVREGAFRTERVGLQGSSIDCFDSDHWADPNVPPRSSARACLRRWTEELPGSWSRRMWRSSSRGPCRSCPRRTAGALSIILRSTSSCPAIFNYCAAPG